MKGEKIFDSMAAHIQTIHSWVPRLPPQETVDIGARLRSLRDKTKDEDEFISNLLKELAKPIPLVGVGVEGANFVAIVSESERITFDSKTFKEDHADLYSQYVRPIPIISLRYKPL